MNMNNKGELTVKQYSQIFQLLLPLHNGHRSSILKCNRIQFSFKVNQIAFIKVKMQIITRASVESDSEVDPKMSTRPLINKTRHNW